jgi:hypothetical protein
MKDKFRTLLAKEEPVMRPPVVTFGPPGPIPIQERSGCGRNSLYRSAVLVPGLGW